MQLTNLCPKHATLPLTFVALALAGAKLATAQPEAMGPAELIRYLTYQTDRPEEHGRIMGIARSFSCGQDLGEERDDRALTKTLLSFGPSALPPLEDALASLEAEGAQSKVATVPRWLLLAYARLRGPAAYARLSRMYKNTGLASYASSLDNATALAFGFTSYLSALNAEQIHHYHECRGTDGASTLSVTPCVAPAQEQPARSFHCDRRNEPRDSLDRLILAWLASNRTSVEASLGPIGKSALREKLAGSGNWDSLRTQLRSGVPGPSIGVGYRFSVSGRWSEPDETIDEHAERTSIADETNRFELQTLFYDSAGNPCGQHKLSFLKASEPGWYKNNDPSQPAPGPTEYLIDNPDIEGLLRLVSVCSAAAAN